MANLHGDTTGFLPQGNRPSQMSLIHRKGFLVAAAVLICMAVVAVMLLRNKASIKSPKDGPTNAPPDTGPRTVPPEITEPAEDECTGEHQDPYITGKHEPCCHSLKKRKGDWDGSARYHFICIDASKGGPTCEATLHNMACVDPRGQWDCFTCGDRINWLQNQGLERKQAQHRVANDFFGECGACAEDRSGFTIEAKGYRVVWRDEFNANGGIDSNKWNSVNAGNGFGNHELQYFTNRQDNDWISDGTLKITAKKEYFECRKYTSAQLETKETWTYGKFSVRAKLQHGTARGTWPANWMRPRKNKYGGWPYSGEIDIMVHMGYEPGRIHGTVHTGAYHKSIMTQKGGAMHVDVKQWHNYTVEWRPEVILFACDNIVYQVFQKESDNSTLWPFNQPFFLILNMAVGGDLGGAKGVDKAAFYGNGQTMEIDWVRIEQRDLKWN